MILYFYGEDSLGSRAALRESVLKFKEQRDPGGYNTVFLDGKKISASKILSEVNTAPFLAEKRLVAVENLLSSSDKETLGEIEKNIKDKKIPENTIVIFWQGEPLGKVKEAKELHEILAKEKYARNFEKMTGTKLVSWIEARIKAGGGEIEPGAARLLAESGEEAWNIASVIDQLCAFTRGRRAGVKDVEEFLEQKLDDNIFNLVDAVVAGDHKRALRLISDQRRLGEDDGKIFGVILWQFRVMVEIADLIEREGNLTSDEAARKLKISPFVARKSFASAKRYPLARLENIYHELLETDLKTKTGRGDRSLLLDLFVAKI